MCWTPHTPAACDVPHEAGTPLSCNSLCDLKQNFPFCFEVDMLHRAESNNNSSSSLLSCRVCLLHCKQVGKVLANDPPGRAQFVHSGGLAAVQQMGEAPGSKLKEAVEIINSCYPEEVVRYYSPSYSQQLLQKLESMAATAQAVA